MAAKIVDREQRRKEIAAAAMSLFSVKGFEATSISQVAMAAGIGKGTIYEYFKSKDELVATSIQLWIEGMISELQTALGSITDPEAKLRAFVHGSVEAFMADQNTIKTTVSVFQEVLSNIDNQTYYNTFQEAFSITWQIIIDIIMEGYSKGIFLIDSEREAEMIAINLMAYLDGILLHHLITGNRFDLRSQVEHYMKFLLEADLKLNRSV